MKHYEIFYQEDERLKSWEIITDMGLIEVLYEFQVQMCKDLDCITSHYTKDAEAKEEYTHDQKEMMEFEAEEQRKEMQEHYAEMNGFSEMH